MSQRGQALTELALLSIVLIFILLGADDFARLYQQNTALQEAAREGARHAAFYSSGTNTNPYLNNSASIVSVVNTVLTGAGLVGPVTWQGSSQCPANAGAAPNSVNQVYVYGCIPTAAASCPGAPAGSGQDVDIAVLMRFNLVVQSNLFFGPAFPMVGDAHFRVQGC
ncbi:MAG TPA: TadE/TadG family type IV pilus assembly protein [Candidatus Dormibacteraeota bacterium]